MSAPRVGLLVTFAASERPLVASLTLLLLIMGAGCAWLGATVAQPPPLIPQTDVVDPSALILSAFAAFVAFLFLIHVLAFLFAWPRDKRLLYAIDYAYLILGLLSLISITSYGIDKATYFRELYANSEQEIRVHTRNYIDTLDRRSNCSYRVMGDVVGYCSWMRDAKDLTDKPLLAQNDVDQLAKDGTRVIAMLGDGSGEARTQIETVNKALRLALQRADVVRTLEHAISATKFPSDFKLYAAYLLAFAAALRITKVTIEMVLIPKAPLVAADPSSAKPRKSYYRVDARAFKDGDMIEPRGTYQAHLGAAGPPTEGVLERVRARDFSGKPQRAAGLYVFDTLACAEQYWRTHKDACLYEVEVDESTISHSGDMTWVDCIGEFFRPERIVLSGKPDVATLEPLAAKYWSGEASDTACIEHLVSNARVIRQLEALSDVRKHVAEIKLRSWKDEPAESIEELTQLGPADGAASPANEDKPLAEKPKHLQ